MTKPVRLGMLAALALVWTVSGCRAPQTPPAAGTHAGPAVEATPAPAGTTLVVGLYPYVPRLKQFESAITAAWSGVQPDVSLTFLPESEWDGGYSNDPPANADVYVFDAMFFEYFRSQGWLEQLAAGEIDHLADFVDYAIDGVEVDGQYYAIPQLGCGNILFYHQDDAALADATTYSEVASALGLCTYTSTIPPDQRGLMVDMAGGTTNAALYLDAVHSITGEYPPPLPWNESEINPEAMAAMRGLLAMTSYENGTTDEQVPYERGIWFGKSWGRALIGFTEAMSVMGPETRSHLGFKAMPLSDNDTSTMFYADVIAVNPSTHQRETRDLAVQLANVMAGSKTIVASIGPEADNPYPQYLMATRPSTFMTLARTFPLYGEMYALITENNPVLFGLNDQARSWLSAMKNTIRTDARKDYPCACDYQAVEYIGNDSQAPAVCGATCADHGSWTGQWTNQPPAAPAGTSVCGCTACPSP